MRFQPKQKSKNIENRTQSQTCLNYAKVPHVLREPKNNGSLSLKNIALRAILGELKELTELGELKTIVLLRAQHQVLIPASEPESH